MITKYPVTAYVSLHRQDYPNSESVVDRTFAMD